MIYNFSFYFCPSFLVSLWSNLMNGVQGNPLVELTHGMWAEGSIYHLTTAHQHVWSFEMCVTLKNVRPRTWQNTEGEYVGWLGHCCLLNVGWLYPQRSDKSACALAHALFVTPIILQGPCPITHPFTICPPLLWHMPFPHLPWCSESGTNASALCSGAPREQPCV